jgi:cation-transporting ATPase E
MAAYAGYQAERWFEPGTGVAGGRTAATLVVLLVSLWTLGILARPLVRWKLGLLVAMAAIVALVVLVPALGHDVVLLVLTPTAFLVAAVVGVTGVVLVELVDRLAGRPTYGHDAHVPSQP